MTRARIRDPGLVIGTLALTLLASLGIASAGTSVGRVNLADRQGASYARDTTFFRPFAASLLQELLGSPILAESRAHPRQTPPESSDPNTTQPGGNDPQDGSPVLASRMRADRTTASRGDKITYTIDVSNLGSGDATDAVLESHVPTGTALVGGENCGANPVSVDPNGACIDVGSVFAAPAPGDHGVVFHFPQLVAHSTETVSFSVTVQYDTESGTVIDNLSHLHAENAPHVDSNHVSVTVA